MTNVQFAIAIPDFVIQFGCAALAGMLLGLERAYRGKVASITTFSMLSLGSCIFTMLGLEVVHFTSGPVDPLRVAAQIVSGIGFVGAGVIFKDKDKNLIEGITTAVMIWLAASVGMACGINKLDYALWGVIFYFIALFIAHKMHNCVEFFTKKLANKSKSKTIQKRKPKQSMKLETKKDK